MTKQVQGPDTVAQLAAMIARFGRLQAINVHAGDLPDGEWTVEDERTLLIAASNFAVADQLQRIADALTTPIADVPLEIPLGDDPLVD